MKSERKEIIDFTRLFDILPYHRNKYLNKKALNFYDGNRWISYGIELVEQRIHALSAWFMNEGYSKGEKILIVPLSGHPDWIIIDFACQQLGLVVVPVHPSSSTQDIRMVFSETEAKLCICFNTFLYHKIKEAIGEVPAGLKLYHLEEHASSYFHPVKSENISEPDRKRLETIKASITDQDLLTILYTSGSTGVPKGIMLSHANVVFNIKSILYILPLAPQDAVISFLPFSHIFERVACFTYLACGASVYFNQTANRFVDDFKEVRPILCTSVPRVLEKMVNYVEAQKLVRSPLVRGVMDWAIRVGEKYVPFDTGFNPLYKIKLAIARWLVLHRWKKILGGKIKYIVVGAAALQPRVSQLFSAAKVQIVEGYGMTEAAPFISVNRFEPGLNRIGTVGIPLPGIEVRIDEPDDQGEGEVLVKGPNIMQGYFKRPELTRAAFTPEGWLRTGDIGKWVHHRFLKITDRKKDLFKTSAGVYISPQPLQLFFCTSPFIVRCLILGFQRKYVTALIVPDFEVLQAWCHHEKIHWTSPKYMVHNVKVRNKIQSEINRLNEERLNVEKVRDFILCEEDWAVEKGELTTALKPVRNILLANYQKEIDKMYMDKRP